MAAFRHLWLTFVLFACSSTEGQESTEQDHTAGLYVQANSKYLWNGAPTLSETREYLRLNAGKTYEAEPLGLDHPLTLRMQAWLNRIDDVVRTRVSNLESPRPVAVIQPARRTYNAWVSKTDTCLTGSASLAAQNFLGNGKIEPSACLPNAWGSTQDFPSYWATTGDTCTFESSQNGLTLSASASRCVATVSFPRNAPFAIQTTSPFVHFSTDLLQHLDEDAFVVVLAHELGHYYRAHPLFRTKLKYRFWYEANSATGKREKVTGPLLSELESAYRFSLDSLPKRQGLSEEHHIRTTEFIASFSGGYFSVGQPQPFPACEQAAQAWRTSTWQSALTNSSEISAEVKADYARFSEAFRVCADAIRVGQDVPMLRLHSIASYRGYANFEPIEGETLSALLTRINATHRANDERTDEVLAKIRANNVGFYTTEQEADELAMEFMTKLGFSPERVMRAWLVVMRSDDARRHTDEATRCEARLNSEFTERDAMGREVPAFEPLGDLDEDHHTNCYRLYNMWRESKAHGYNVGMVQPQLTPGWNTLKREAAKLSN